ncbi:MAG: single-stranded-DNA-specific exonuclease RecJ [Planctomycetota bacterium]|nr:single-stranded-DNA-specific exonuclease RecJ [Planctomycetota bacterium]
MTPTLTAPATRWTLRRVDPSTVEAFMRTQRLSEVGARLLAARGILDAKAASAHLEPKLSALHDPALFSDMKLATQRIVRAIEHGETILVHGDYDVDGVTGTTLLMRLFGLLGAKVHWHIPNRFTDGYSFGPHSIVKAKEVGATLVISVDNGTSAHETIHELKRLGVDTIVTDHHEPSEGELPEALAIVNPKIERARYPFRELCGGAVAFKLAWGLAQELSGASKVREDLREFLVDAMGYVAIATVCDVVPLIDENRVLAHYGLRSLANSKDAGIRALLAVTELSGRTISSEDLAFKVGPRINASGRLGSAHKAVELLLTRDATEARTRALALDELNTERKRIESDLLREALVAAAPFADRNEHPVLVLAGQGWHQGVVGIIAARLVSRFERPAIVIGLNGATGRGSARSVAGFSVLDAMHGAKDHFEHYGGHEQAAGMSVAADKIDRVREAVCARATTMLGATGFASKEVRVDSEIAFESMTPELMRELDRFQPFGERNEKPVLLSCDLRLAEPPRLLGADQTHLMLKLRSGNTVLKAMGFGQARRAKELALGQPIHVAYTPKWNTFRGETNLEIEIVDLKTGARPTLA